MKLENIKANFLGDSITEGHCASTPDKCYIEILKQKYGLSEARNYGISGTRIARQQRTYMFPEFDRDFCSRVGDMDKDADIVIVFGGTNDHGHGDAPSVPMPTARRTLSVARAMCCFPHSKSASRSRQ